MKIIRLIKYPGSKMSLLPDINSVFRKSRSRILVDVFGGSGLVSLNLGADYVIYNDLDGELVNLFRIIKNRPEDMYTMILNTLPLSFREDLPATINGHHPRYHEQREGLASGNKAWKNERIRKLHYVMRSSAGNAVQIDRALANAYRTLYRSITSFGGLGETYATGKEKAAFSYFLKMAQSFGEIADRVGRWKIERMDFRELISRYDSPDAFLYLDPPYPGKDWYRYNFNLDDYRMLAASLRSLKGSYMLTLSGADSYISEMFGKPSFVREYRNQNGSKENGETAVRSFYFFTNVQTVQ